jgi:hypothetical protein
MNKEQIRQHLLSSGVKNLKEFGYQEVNDENLLTDQIYSAFFKSMLEDNRGLGSPVVNEVIDELLNQITG